MNLDSHLGPGGTTRAVPSGGGRLVQWPIYATGSCRVVARDPGAKRPPRWRTRTTGKKVRRTPLAARWPICRLLFCLRMFYFAASGAAKSRPFDASRVTDRRPGRLRGRVDAEY